MHEGHYELLVMPFGLTNHETGLSLRNADGGRNPRWSHKYIVGQLLKHPTPEKKKKKKTKETPHNPEILPIPKEMV